MDPFVGSGTTMKVAKDLGRNSVGIEIKPDHEKIIRQKLGANPMPIGMVDSSIKFSVVRRSEPNSDNTTNE